MKHFSKKKKMILHLSCNNRNSWPLFSPQTATTQALRYSTATFMTKVLTSSVLLYDQLRPLQSRHALLYPEDWITQFLPYNFGKKGVSLRKLLHENRNLVEQSSAGMFPKIPQS